MARKAYAFSSWLCALGALTLGVCHSVFSSGPFGLYTWIAISLFAVSFFVGTAAHHPASSVATFAALSISVLMTARYFESHDSTIGTPLRVEAAFLVLQFILIIWIAGGLRERMSLDTRNVAVDGLIVALGSWVLVWVVLVQPTLNVDSALMTMVRASTVGASVLVIFLFVTYFFSAAPQSSASNLFGLSIVFELLGIVLRAVDARADVQIATATVDGPFIIAVGLTGAAFLHPSIRRLTASQPVRLSPPLMSRLTITTASLIAPIIVLALIDPSDFTDRTVRTISVSVLAVVVMARVIQSVRSNAATQSQLVRNALTDSLTGLPNRVLMIDHIESAIENSWRTAKQPSVLFVDIDRFKNINDSLGHSIGDHVLTELSARLLSALPTTSTVARIAGDEFVVLDTDTESPTQSVLLAEAVLDAMRTPIASPDGDMFVTASIGVAYAPKGIRLTAEDLMRHADTAMYRAKNAGRNCIALFDDSMLETVSKRLDVETALYRALERNELHLVHQPICDLDLGLVVGFEALMRWDRGESGVMSPAEFIPIAEETGTIVPLGSWAINDALMQLRSWIETSVCLPNTTMSVNVSPRQLNDPDFVNVVSTALQVSGIPAPQLWLEVTESVMITEPEQALASLRRLHSLGVRIAIDDFGTGYSSLSLLQRFPVECIKIDRSFVNDIVTDVASRNLVKTIIAMASTMGADIVAEGIENKEQLAVLSSLQCRRAQGYLISKPVRVQEIPELVQRLQDPAVWRQLTSD
jgi:diguanylate cyclase (GGDEF)-like protein